MPDSMNFANDPNGMPQQGWDPNQFGQMPDPYAQQMYPGQDMQNQMYGGMPMPGQGYPMYQDPVTGQPIYGDPSMQGMYYPDPAEGPDRMARDAQTRASSIFGPKGAPQQQMGMNPGATGQQPPVQSGMNPGFPQQQMGGQPGMPQQMGGQPQQGQAPNQNAQDKKAKKSKQKKQKAAKSKAPKPNANVSGGSATISLVLGVLSIFFALLPPIGIILGIVSMVLAKRYKANGGTASRADSGRIFGLVGLVFSLVMLVVYLVLYFFMAGATSLNYNARAMAVYFNHSPLGSIYQFLNN